MLHQANHLPKGTGSPPLTETVPSPAPSVTCGKESNPILSIEAELSAVEFGKIGALTYHCFPELNECSLPWVCMREQMQSLKGQSCVPLWLHAF